MPKKSKSRTATKRQTNATSVTVDAASTIREQQQAELQRIQEALDAAVHARANLAGISAEIEAAEAAAAKTAAAQLADITTKHSATEATLGERSQQLEKLEGEAKEIIKQLRSTVTGICSIPDPLNPLADGQDDSSLTRALSDLRAQADRRAGTPESLSDAAEALTSTRAVADLITTRVKEQTTRVKGLLKDLSTLETARDDLSKQLAAAAEAGDQQAAELSATKAELETTQETLETTEQRLASAEADIESGQEAASAAESEAAAHIADIEGQLATSEDQRSELETQLSASNDLAHKAERSALDLADVLVAFADGAGGDDVESGLPSAALQRDELESLANDAGDDFGDEIDELFADDLGEDLVTAARNLCEALTARHSTLLEALAEAKDLATELESSLAQSEVEAGQTAAELTDTKGELERTSTELSSTQDAANELSSQLEAATAELSEAQATIDAITAELDTVRSQAELVAPLSDELKNTKGDLAAVTKDLEAGSRSRATWNEAQTRLARELVDMAEACDAALSVADLKQGSGVGRFTKTFQKLEETTTSAAGDVLRMVKVSLEVVEKVTVRLGLITRELQERGEALSQAERTVTTLGERNAKLDDQLTKAKTDLAALKQERSELSKEAKRALKLDEKLAKREGELAEAAASAKETSKSLRQTRAELEEIRAREEAASASADGELGDLKRRLAASEAERRQSEADADDARDTLQAEISTLEARSGELERMLEARDNDVSALQTEVDQAGDQAAQIRELSKRLTNSNGALEQAEAKIRMLQSEVDAAAAGSAVQDDLDATIDERDALAASLREAEKRLADQAGTIASLESRNSSISGKLDSQADGFRSDISHLEARLEQTLDENRRMKEQNAGLTARVRTLTEN